MQGNSPGTIYNGKLTLGWHVTNQKSVDNLIEEQNALIVVKYA